MTPKPRDPIQVYLTPSERNWLDALARRDGISRSEVLRRGIRRLMAESPSPATSPLLAFLADAAADPELSAGPTDVGQRPIDYLVDGYLDRRADAVAGAGTLVGGPLYLDTGFWFAAIVPRDDRHARCRAELEAAIRGRRHLVTTILVVAEVHALLVGRASAAISTRFLEVLADPQVEVVYPDAEAVRGAGRAGAGRTSTLTELLGAEIETQRRSGRSS